MVSRQKNFDDKWLNTKLSKELEKPKNAAYQRKFRLKKKPNLTSPEMDEDFEVSSHEVVSEKNSVNETDRTKKLIESAVDTHQMNKLVAQACNAPLALQITSVDSPDVSLSEDFGSSIDPCMLNSTDLEAIVTESSNSPDLENCQTSSLASKLDETSIEPPETYSSARKPTIEQESDKSLSWFLDEHESKELPPKTELLAQNERAKQATALKDQMEPEKDSKIYPGVSFSIICTEINDNQNSSSKNEASILTSHEVLKVSPRQPNVLQTTLPQEDNGNGLILAKDVNLPVKKNINLPFPSKEAIVDGSSLGGPCQKNDLNKKTLSLCNSSTSLQELVDSYVPEAKKREGTKAQVKKEPKKSPRAKKEQKKTPKRQGPPKNLKKVVKKSVEEHTADDIGER